MRRRMVVTGNYGLLIFLVVVVKIHGDDAPPQPIPPTKWWLYPFPINAVILLGYQRMLQQKNLIDSYNDSRIMTYSYKPCTDPLIGQSGLAPTVCDPVVNRVRMIDGQCNDFDNPASGSVHYRFGRNVPLASSVPDKDNLLVPNPRMISRKLLSRKDFIPAKSINLLIAAWIQFMIHDWFDHGPNELRRRKIKVPLEYDDPNFNRRYLRIPYTRRDSCRNRRKPYDTYQNIVTHWWDASQIYGNDNATNSRVRSFSNGKLLLDENGRLPIDPATGIPITGHSLNWWVGLGMMHILWAKEHNYVCDMLMQNITNITWTDEKLFQTARLIIAAVIAKIHILEWTTAVLDNDIVKLGLKANWNGLTLLEFAGGNATLAAIIAAKFPALTNGLPGALGNPKDVHGVPYSLTEEFTSVYRMHPFLPEKIVVRDHQTNAKVKRYRMANSVFSGADTVFQENSMANLFYTFGKAHPGAMTLHNYPRFLQKLNLPDFSPHGNGRIDLGTVDIVRDRERGIPRYNELRRLIHLDPIATFDNLTTNSVHVAELREVYNDDVEQLDLLVGSLAESPLPSVFGFSDTFFRIFVLMARRRIMADRFYTDDYTAEFYTQWGLDYIDETWMKSILLRHYPDLASNLQYVNNVFVPWQYQTTPSK